MNEEKKTTAAHIFNMPAPPEYTDVMKHSAEMLYGVLSLLRTGTGSFNPDINANMRFAVSIHM